MLDMLHPQAPKPCHKDKLAATKKHDEEIHEALKAAREEEKEKLKQGHASAAKAAKMERAFHMVMEPESKHSKRAIKEAHEAEKKAADKAAAEGQLCEHGVNKCRICFPHKHHKELAHGHERKPQVEEDQE